MAHTWTKTEAWVYMAVSVIGLLFVATLIVRFKLYQLQPSGGFVDFQSLIVATAAGSCFAALFVAAFKHK